MRVTTVATISTALGDNRKTFASPARGRAGFQGGRTVRGLNNDVTVRDHEIKGNKSGLIKARYILSYLLGSSRLVSLSVEISFPFISG
jgi:hypothetical protein